ncbi:oxidoreductase [Corynebacterium phocae]|uniref:glycine oxidase n=1 Tax=Corynebacterium phocae TaxID=161895 RepID=A0A1L7D2C3_9CORY|nr:glycine oxidase ThiO [Corynebacterium phocae]APT92306.1 oxidoreductase [Corynebacterium phocae]KAA8725341.1 glycine oxidase ThiO [Corynebacterium phocae]
MSTVIVIGSGIVGLASAFELQLAGHQVTIIDPSPISGATHHAGGMLAPAAEVVYKQDALFPLMRDSAALYPGLIARVEAHTDLPTGYDTAGTLVVGADRADAQHITQLREYQTSHGMEAEFITVSNARTLEPGLSPRLSGAASMPYDTQVSPRMFAAALADAASNLGATTVREQALEVCGETVITSQNSHRAEKIVLAAGLGAAKISGWYEGENPLQLRPVYGDILRLRVPAHLRPLCSRVIRGFVEDRPVYIIPRVDNTIAIGATTREDGQPLPVVGGVYDLLRDAIRLVPGIEECPLLEATAGARPGTPDDLPYLGAVSENLIVSTGYFRHGILLSALAANSTLALVEGRKPTTNLSACSPYRHSKDV